LAVFTEDFFPEWGVGVKEVFHGDGFGFLAVIFEFAKNFFSERGVGFEEVDHLDLLMEVFSFGVFVKDEFSTVVIFNAEEFFEGSEFAGGIDGEVPVVVAFAEEFGEGFRGRG
jgi:hypothetical protein